jgi:mono/diheme cytochrome c family protein
MKRKEFLAILALLTALAAWWLLKPEGRVRRTMPPLAQQLDPAVLAEVGASYTRDVQPLFKAACFDCHTKDTVWPWYHAVPGVRQFIEGHVEDGRRALDMGDGFPFNHGAHVLKDLRRIAGNVQRGEMPLFSYRLMHPGARLTDAQRGLIVRWAQDSFDRLTTTARDADAPGAAPAIPDGHHHHDAA